jgi:phosphoglucosamine mutase
VPSRAFADIRIVVDCANGAMSDVAPYVLAQLGATVIAIHCEPNGKNINAECGATYPKIIGEAVRLHQAAIGLAFDGDGDRVIGVDHAGNIVDGDHLLALAAIDMQERKVLDGNGVVVTVMTNAGFHEAMARHGISVVTTPVGDRSVLIALDENKYSLGGEQSGHIIYRKDATTGDGLLAGVRLVDLVRRKNVTLQKLAQDAMTSLPQVLINVRVESVASDLATQFAQEIAVAERDLNGVGRVLLRASGTEPLVRVMVEAQFEETANSVAQRLAASVIKRLGGSR